MNPLWESNHKEISIERRKFKLGELMEMEKKLNNDWRDSTE